jgi:glycosyltransferase involved in cell wall biosynthesis
MRDTPADLTTVVIPAYNAAATIDRTLATVRAQTHQALEIIVVDDGSTDATADIVRQHLQADARVRLIQQANAGVAAARNAAIAAGQGAFIAPIDADDLWHPRKIEKQLAAMHQGGPRVCLVNTGLALIDTDDRVLALLGSEVHTGDALRPLCEGSFLGCGSNPLMRAVPVRDVGGYDPSLRRQAAEGCEDFQLSRIPDGLPAAGDQHVQRSDADAALVHAGGRATAGASARSEASPAQGAGQLPLQRLQASTRRGPAA